MSLTMHLYRHMLMCISTYSHAYSAPTHKYRRILHARCALHASLQNLTVSNLELQSHCAHGSCSARLWCAACQCHCVEGAYAHMKKMMHVRGHECLSVFLLLYKHSLLGCSAPIRGLLAFESEKQWWHPYGKQMVAFLVMLSSLNLFLNPSLDRKLSSLVK